MELLNRLLLMLLLSFSLIVSAEEEIVRCFEPGQCRGNLVGSSKPESLDLCLQECLNQSQCNYYSYNEEGSTCLLFSECDELAGENVEFVSSRRDCALTTSTCFQNVTCHSSETLIVNETTDLDVCWELCWLNEKCSYFEFDPISHNCTTLFSCPEYTISDGALTSSVYCDLKEYDCYFNAKCEGDFAEAINSDSVELCYDHCQQNEECQWFVQNDGLCTLYKTCTDRQFCPTCTAGRRDCPPSPNTLLHLDIDTGGNYLLRLSNLLEWTNAEIQPNVVLMPGDLNLANLSIACWSRQSQIAIFCETNICYHYSPGRDEAWAESTTTLAQIPAGLTQAICTEIANGTLVITGINTTIQTIEPSIEAPPNQSTLLTQTLPDERSAHCVLMLDESRMFVGFGSVEGAYVVDTLTWQASPLVLSEISVTEIGCGLITDPDDGKQKIMIVGGQYRGSYPITEDFQGLLFIDPEDWSYEEKESLANEVHVPHKVRGTDLPLFIAKSRTVDGSSYILLYDFEQGWIEQENTEFWPQNDFFGFGITL